MKTFPKSTEQIQDIVTALLVEGTGVTLAYNDGAGTLTISSSVDLTGYATTAYVDDEVSANGASLQAFASNASNLSSGTVADARLSSNVARLNSANTGASIATTTFIVQAIASQTSPIQEWKRSDGVVGARVDTAGRVDIYSAKFHAGSGVGYSLVSVCDPNLGIAIYNAGSINWSSTGAATGTADVKILRNATGPTLETRAAGGLKVCNADGSALAALACGSIDVTPVNASWLFSGTEALIKRGNTGIGTASGGFGSTSLFFSVNSQNSMCLAPGSGMGWLLLNNSYMIGFTSSPASSHATTTLSEASTGVMQIGTSGASGKNALGSLNLTNLTASGGITFGPRTKSALLATSATATAGVWRITDSTPAQRLAYPDGTNWRYMSDDTVVT